jgi:hypothetical protein
MPIKTNDDIVDEGSAFSFPASDPPSYMASIVIAGAPANQEGETPKGAAGKAKKSTRLKLVKRSEQRD